MLNSTEKLQINQFLSYLTRGNWKTRAHTGRTISAFPINSSRLDAGVFTSTVSGDRTLRAWTPAYSRPRNPATELAALGRRRIHVHGIRRQNSPRLDAGVFTSTVSGDRTRRAWTPAYSRPRYPATELAALGRWRIHVHGIRRQNSSRLDAGVFTSTVSGDRTQE